MTAKYPSSYKNQAKTLTQESLKLHQQVTKLRRQNHQYDLALQMVEMHAGNAEKMLEYIRAERKRIGEVT